LGSADAQYNMENQSAGVDDPNLQLARQLYDRSMELYGEDHEQTRLLARYKSQMENRGVPMPGLKLDEPSVAPDVKLNEENWGADDDK
jgi:hypothetical protein